MMMTTTSNQAKNNNQATSSKRPLLKRSPLSSMMMKMRMTPLSPSRNSLLPAKILLLFSLPLSLRLKNKTKCRCHLLFPWWRMHLLKRNRLLCGMMMKMKKRKVLLCPKRHRHLRWKPHQFNNNPFLKLRLFLMMKMKTRKISSLFKNNLLNFQSSNHQPCLAKDYHLL